MGEVVSRGQALEITARVGTQVNWEGIDGDKLQSEVISLSPDEFGRRFTAFLKNGCRIIMGAVRTIATVPFNPKKFIGEGWDVWRGPSDGDGLSGEEDEDKRSLAIQEIDPSRIIFETCLKRAEKSIIGEEKIKRLKKMANKIRLGANVFLAFWKDYQENGENSILEWLHQTQGITFIDFPGTILRYPSGSRSVLCLYRGGRGEWSWGFSWLDSDWYSGYPSALANLFVSPPYLGEEFCFNSCPLQPPSILPISAIFSESEIYFLLSSDFVSQRIRKKTFIVSVFLMASFR